MWSMGQQHQHHLGDGWRWRISDFSSGLLDQSPFSKIPRDSCAWAYPTRSTVSWRMIMMNPRYLDGVIDNQLLKFLKEWAYQTTLSVFWETCVHVKKKQIEPYMEQLTGSKLGKEYNTAVYCQLAYLTSMQNTSCEMSNWMSHKLESRLQQEISTTSDMQVIPL